MAHFGVLCFSGAGHLNPLLALSRELVRRGHRVTFLHGRDIEEQVLKSGLEFAPLGCESGIRTAATRPRAKTGLAALRFRIRRTVEDMERVLRLAPEAVRRAGVQVLLIDEIAMAGPTVAEVVGIPYFVISTSVPHNFGWSAPRRMVPPASWTARLQRALLEVSVVRMHGPVRYRLDRYRRSIGLGGVSEIHASWPPLAQVTQLPRCLDYRHRTYPKRFHYTAPFIDGKRFQVAFPWQLLDGRPVIYASLGTTLKGDPSLFAMIAEACSRLEVQLVVSLGGRRTPETFKDLPGQPIVVKNAPQLDLLPKTEAVITHAGPNTAFEALLCGKPMLALPRAFDQPAIAARLEACGAAIVLGAREVSAGEIYNALQRILSDSSFRRAAQAMQVRMSSTPGLTLAADILEQALAENALAAVSRRDASVTYVEGKTL